jgi:hypothetical protein
MEFTDTREEMRVSLQGAPASGIGKRTVIVV